MKYTVKMRGEQARPATFREEQIIRNIAKLHRRYWMWQLIRAVAWITAIYLLVRIVMH